MRVRVRNTIYECISASTNGAELVVRDTQEHDHAIPLYSYHRTDAAMDMLLRTGFLDINDLPA